MARKSKDNRDRPRAERGDRSPENGGSSDAAVASVPRSEPRFPVIGIGASAGGLKAFETFFEAMPPTSGMAFVLVQHLSAPNKSILDELIRRHTSMAVAEVEDGVEVVPDHVYIIPPGADLALMNGRLHLIEPEAGGRLRLPIDFFFRSLAQDRRDRAVCLVLSGTGTDGTLGICAVKEQGGLVMIQDPATADYDGMPRSAAATGLADYVLPVEAIPAQLVAHLTQAHGPARAAEVEPLSDAGSQLEKAFVLLRAHTGHDFSHYKQSTIRRRIEKRMVINRIDDVSAYVRYLRHNPLELEVLFRELLISVTRFFRDPDAFAALEKKVVPALLDRPVDLPIRVWVPGCATGEEAYSIAMLLDEHIAQAKKPLKVKIFATDIDKVAVDAARAGIYPEGVVADLATDRLARYLVRLDSSYRIGESIRPWLVFAEQSVIADPPYSRVDLISCRNLLIYLEPELQQKVLSLFHYALRPGGHLLLGSSESVGASGDLFFTVDRKWKIFRRNDAGAGARAPFVLPSPAVAAESGAGGQSKTAVGATRTGFRELAERALLEHCAPACTIVNENGDLLYVHGSTGQYLEPAVGEATLNILRMARPGLRLGLAMALRQATDRDEPVRCPALEVATDRGANLVNLTVRRLAAEPPSRRLLMVTFEAAGVAEAGAGARESGEPASAADRRVERLERELAAKEDYLQGIVEELQSSNEELQSSNEELQSSNEELETSKEELQSVNEELVTVNTEVQEKVAKLTQASNDIANLLAGTDIGTVFLDQRLRIRSFTPAATRAINLIGSDVGRPVADLASNLVDHEELGRSVQRVLDTLVPFETEVASRDGECFLMRILPYRTLQNSIDGVVLTFTDITGMKRAQHEVGVARDLARSIVETVREPLLTIDHEFRVVSANRAFCEFFQVGLEHVEGRSLTALGAGEWDVPELMRLLRDVLPERTVFDDFVLESDFPGAGRRRIILNAREIRRGAGDERLILLAMEDATGAPGAG